MALGIYKQGQGYWVRMMTAIFAGILVLACAAWVWQSIARIEPPSAGRSVQISQPRGATPDVGEAVEFMADGTAGPIATGVVRGVSSETGGLALWVGDIALTEAATAGEIKQDETQAQTLRTADGFSGSVAANGMPSVPAIEMTYVRAAAAGVVILAGAALIFLFVGQKPKQVDFLIATDAEGRKVNWSTRKEIIGSTWVVIAAMFLIAGTLFLIDLVFQGVFSAINVLER